MSKSMKRRNFLGLLGTGSMMAFTKFNFTGYSAENKKSRLISPGCRGTKVKVARLYLGTSHGLWPKPKLDFEKEIKFYLSQFEKYKDQLTDVEFVIDQLLTAPEEIQQIKDKLKTVDGIIAIHFNIGIRPILNELLQIGKPTVLFADPYSGHEWVGFGELQKQELGANLECVLSSDYSQLTRVIRPFRAIHHLREAKILNLTTRDFEEYANEIKTKYGTEIKKVNLERIVVLYDSISKKDIELEANLWIENAVQVIEPDREDILKSCRMALAFEKLLDEENATVMTVDCYGSMFEPLCRKYAYPCVGFVRLNNMGLGGICESDLQCAMTHIIFQGLSGKPGFISDPTVDEHNNTIILAHCLGTLKMNGITEPSAPYKLRSIMERKEGVVPQVKMSIGETVTQAKLVGTDFMPYFIGQIVDVPETDRGCRTKITVKVEGNVTSLWQNWSSGLHRVTCYGDLTQELRQFSRYQKIRLVNEAV
jgi:hypothetical protein